MPTASELIQQLDERLEHQRSIIEEGPAAHGHAQALWYVISELAKGEDDGAGLVYLFDLLTIHEFFWLRYAKFAADMAVQAHIEKTQSAEK
jgi:hypothetical protein